MKTPDSNAIRRVYELATREMEADDDRACKRELARLLSNSPVARRAYLEFIEESAALKWKFAESSPRPATAVVITPRLSRLRKAFLAGLLSLAATIVIAAVTWNGLGQDGVNGRDAQKLAQGKVEPLQQPNPSTAKPALGQRSTDEVGTVVHLSNAVWSDGNSKLRELSRVNIGQQFSLRSGRVELVYDVGAEVILTGPCVFEVSSPVEGFCRSGVVAARVTHPECGFAIHTPYAKVIDLGTAFGIEVDEQMGGADVVVFEGSVDVEYASSGLEGPTERRRLYMGEGAHVNLSGTLSRIVSISAGQFGRLSRENPQVPSRPALVSSVGDDIARNDSMKFYEIVPGGMREDSLAYVDRPAHTWNGMTTRGMPSYLVGGDLVKFFNDDKVVDDMTVWIRLEEPAMLYVLFDDRIPPPDWLKQRFVDTGDDIGLDLGPYTQLGSYTDEGEPQHHEHLPGVGPGESIDDTFSIWRMEVREPGEIQLGATAANAWEAAMYGIVAVRTNTD